VAVDTFRRGLAMDLKRADLCRYKVVYRAIACGEDCSIDWNIMEVLADL